jgi:hypothetical protein
MMTIIGIIVYLIGFVIIWEIDKRSIKNEAFVNFPDNVRRRIILSVFSWVLLIPFLIVWGIAGIIDKDNL